MLHSQAGRPRVALLTLGCAKNLVDSEKIASLLERAGVAVIHDPEEATVAVINTCGFIDSAREESIAVITEAAARKERGELNELIVTGCLGERYGTELAEALPEADAVLGVDPREAAQVALRALGRSAEPLPSGAVLRTSRLTAPGSSYLRISHGCDNRCAYCAIPLIRGPLRSRPMEELLEEARFLARQGVGELNVIAQDTANYGIDSAGRRLLHELAARLCEVDGLRWVRLLYLHPAHLYQQLVGVMADRPKICPYVDVPLQHISDRILRAMGRGIRRRQIEQMLERLRRRIPGLTLRTTFLTGFPGEREEDFEELLGFVREQRFDRLGCFAYSPEEDTPAAEMAEQVDREVAERRRDELMSVQQEIAFELAEGRRGEVTEVLAEPRTNSEDDLWPARSSAEAPDVDPLIYVSGKEMRPGRFYEVRIAGGLGYDCVAELTDGEQTSG